MGFESLRKYGLEIPRVYLYCWGGNYSGQIGNGTTETQTTPVKVLSDVSSVYVYGSGYANYAVSDSVSGSVAAITKDGDLYRWGCNVSGQVGNGTTENQTTPVKVLSDVNFVSVSEFDSVAAITKNGDLYCWGYNNFGQVGNGTTENQLTPVLIMGPSITPGLHKNGCLQIPDAITLAKGKDTYITGKVFADDLDKLKEMSNSLVWSSANPSVATVENMGCLIPINENAKETIIVAKVTGISRGETDVFVSAPDGSKVCCHVVVGKSTEAAEEPEQWDYDDCFSIAGELQEVDSANEMIKIDGVAYEKLSDSVLTDAKNILEQHDNKIVACKVRAADNKIVRIDDVKDIIGKPSVYIEPEISNITYENGKFSKESFKVDLYMYCDIKYPYTISNISDVVNKVNGLEIAFSKLSLTTAYDDTGTFAFLLKDGFFASQETTIEKKLDFKLKPGQRKKISVTAYVKEDNFSKKNVNADAIIEAKINDDEKTRISSYSIHLSNLDKAREKEQKRLANSPKTPELQKANNILNGIHVAYSDLDLSKCLTDTELEAVSAQVYNWIYTLNALNIIINDDSDSSVLKKLLKKCGLTKEELQNKVLKKMGIDKNVIPLGRSYTGTLQFESKDKNTGKNITIKFTADMNLYTLGGSTYAAWGTLKYKISSGGSGEGPITYTNMDSFVASLKKVVESQIHNCFNKTYGEGINKIYNDLVADSLISSTFANLVNAKYGSGSEVVYTGLKSAFTGYTEEDAKKSIKDVVIILTKDAIKKKTEALMQCPVDVTVYDGDGNICAEIVDDVVNKDYQDVAVYVKGEDKYLLLTDTDYIICYSGNDTGTMNYTVTEYEDDKEVRKLIYNDVPLTTEKKYVNYLANGRHQGSSLYNLHEVGGDVIEATFDIDKTKEQAASVEAITLSDKTLSLKKGQSYILMETISPIDAVIRDITWSSSNEEVVEVSGSGVLYAKTDGEAVITVEIDGSNLSDSCKVTVGQKNASPIPNITDAPTTTEKPNITLNPLDTPNTDITSSTNPTVSPKPSGGSLGENVSIGSGAISGGGAATVYTATPIPSPSQTPVPVTTPTPIVTSVPVTTPTPTIIPTIKPEVSAEPSVMPNPSASPDTETDNKTGSEKNIKKELKFTDKKTKAVYKITSTGKNKSVQYVKSTKKNITNVTVPASVQFNGNTFKVVSIGKGAFKNNKKLKSVKIGKNVKTIGKKAFSGCTKLDNVKTGKNITSIEANAFNKCTSLIKITIPAKVKKIGKRAFYKCKNLQYILFKTKKLKANSVGKDAFGSGYANPRVKTDKSIWKQYQNIFTSKGLSNKAVFIIDPVKLVI